MIKVSLRKWQVDFTQRLLSHRNDDFLLVACPAAGKTRGAAVAVAEAMRARGCDQLIVVCPTVVVRDQWCRELSRVGYQMLNDFTGESWPVHVHGVCATYMQVAQRIARYRAAVEARPTVVVFDEIHHAGQQLSWGAAIRESFGAARLRLLLSGTPFRSDRDRIPFVRYHHNGNCIADFSYDYGQAVRDGICRPIQFHAHDGVITWRENDGSEKTASFSDEVPPSAQARRLRASLDPHKAYLRTILETAHHDLTQLRETVNDAAGLIVCDSQHHALSVDRLVSEVAGSLPILAMSDLPRAHRAIADFADEDEPWLVSVRMVSEGVDIPRLGVIVWATAATTELMVRQVAGRALRGRDEYAGLPAIVHMPADPALVHHAERLEVLGGTEPRGSQQRRHDRHARTVTAVERSDREIDPTPFVEWFDRQAAASHASRVCYRCGWTPESGVRLLYRWRNEGARPHVLTVLDACHMAGIDFDELFSGEEYAAARAFASSPDLGTERDDYNAVEAQPVEDTKPRVLVPSLPRRQKESSGADIELSTPELPPSPEEIAATEQASQALRGDLLRTLNVYGQLRRELDPTFQIASAQRELWEAVGKIDSESSDEAVAEGLAWARQQVSALATRHPEEFKALARARRRLSLAA
jgi:superfamily II DNA or RNA helicase